MLGPRAEFILTKETYNDKDHSSITNLSQAQAMGDSWLSTVVTHMAYQSKDFGKQNFPMLFLTEGMGNVEKVDNFDYKYNLIGKPKKTSRIGKSAFADGAQVGLGRGEFFVPFEDKHFANQQNIVARGNITLRVQGEPSFRDGYYWYPCILWGTETESVPDALLKEGTVWGAGVFKVPFEDSYGVESRSYLPGAGTNMTSLVRHTYKVKGNVGSKVMRYTIKADGKTFEFAQDWELYLADLDFKEQCEFDIWTSDYGRLSNGDFKVYDKNTGIGIPSGAGIDAQIPNRGTHSLLTYKKLSSIIRDITFNISEATPNVEIWTGTGGMQDIDTVLKDELKGFTLVDSKQFADGSIGGLVYGNYFKAFRHQDGGMVTFRLHPMFDRGIRGDISDKHPISGLPKSSHDLYILDRSTYEAGDNMKNNFQYTMEKGREYVQWEVSGGVTIKGAKSVTGTRQGAHDRDRAEIHGMKSQGIQILRPHGCYKSECL